MFRHRGETRTMRHNLGIASLLSFVAGIVNVAGFLSVQQLTTNVTGHFAFFVDELFKLNLMQGFVYFLYIFFFFLGSFSSNLIVELISRKNSNYAYIIPVAIESIILIFVALLGQEIISRNPDVIAFLLLFAMGSQNSLVTTISNAVVRTTHLTGLFTDLGIELSQLFFYKQKERLLSSIRLRLTIIGFFFAGGITGGILYSTIQLHVLLLAGVILLSGLIFDFIKVQTIFFKEKK